MKKAKEPAVWVQFKKGKFKARLVKLGETVSRVRYEEKVESPGEAYRAEPGEERSVWNIFISSRRE
jgi:hypothetical protein